MRLIFVAVSFVFCLALPGVLADETPSERKLLNRIVADWTERRELFGRGVEVIASGTRLRPKGSAPPAWVDYDPPAEGPFPREDHVSPMTLHMVLDLVGGRWRVENEEEIPGPDPAFHKTFEVRLHDGENQQRWRPRHRNPLVAGERRSTELHEVPGAAFFPFQNELALWVAIDPYFATGEPVKSTLPKSTEFRIVGTVQHNNRELVKLRRAKPSSHDWIELRVDSARQSVVASAEGGPLSTDGTEIKRWELETTYLLSDGLWIPETWCFRRDGDHGGTWNYRVTSFTPDYDASANIFRIEPAVGELFLRNGRYLRASQPGHDPIDVTQELRESD